MAQPAELPSAKPIAFGSRIVVQPPLTRLGTGPGLVIIRPAGFSDYQAKTKTLDPEPLQKWAEEGFAVAQITLDAQDKNTEILHSLNSAQKHLQDLLECTSDKSFGLIVYGSRSDYGGLSGDAFCTLAPETIKAVVFFDTWESKEGQKLLLHAASYQRDTFTEDDTQTAYFYPDIVSSGFIVPGHPDFKISTAGVAHTRGLAFLKKNIGGPYFDLEKIWDEHTYYEFGDRSVEKTMATMVQEPYVNHVPTMTGGIGRARLSHFYLHHFIFNNPDDTALELISRTIGTDRIVDEFIFCLTHVKQVDWLIPGIPPTGKPLRIPFTSVVNIRGDRLYHEHIAWDQATVLVQLGLLPEYLPFPYSLPDGTVPAAGKRFEYRVPAAGVETANKLQNEHEFESNEMIGFKIREVDDR
ncbi:hypothetical protein N7478_011659 [Penicillium angulare]|uniref:uncharacterized protein n=1 Tax=Penicillium angulare TaxID=116970 RepID=UPI002542068D|nr:uncharacterized protein N7478_011659 [Penicillium angulare]KAJ5261064.1 hypothetical protein N7478_011659 [Penicillium angulare]